MKRIGNLKPIWTNYEVLYRAFVEVKKGKSYSARVINYEMDLVNNLNKLQKSLIDEVYVPKSPTVFTITEPKIRIIEAPDFEDRIVQHALLIATKRIIESRFVYGSYACRKDKGTHKASRDLSSGLKYFKNIGYYLKIDIKKFFYSIDHAVMMEQLGKIIKCKPTLNLFALFFKNDNGIGLPLGNVTSQVLANLALTNVDNFAKRVLKHKYYYRYMDDIIILHKDKNVLKNSLESLSNLVAINKLQLNGKTNIGKLSEGVDFVGYRTWFNLKVIRKRSLYNINKKLKKDANIQRVSSFLAHAKTTNSLNYVTKIIINTTPIALEFIKEWYIKNIGEQYVSILQS